MEQMVKATGPPPDEVVPPLEPREPCDICGRMARQIKWVNRSFINENLRLEEVDISSAEESTCQDCPDRKRRLCSRCYSRFCRIHQSKMKAKQATLDLLVSWRRGRSRAAAVATLEPGEPEDDWEVLEDLPDDMPDFEMAMAGIEQDIFFESDESSTQNRLSDLYDWGT